MLCLRNNANRQKKWLQVKNKISHFSIQKINVKQFSIAFFLAAIKESSEVEEQNVKSEPEDKPSTPEKAKKSSPKKKESPEKVKTTPKTEEKVKKVNPFAGKT